MTAWPSTLPQIPLLSGFSQSQADTSIRSAMSYGPDKVRRRTTAAIEHVSFSMVMDDAQITALDTFYNVTISVSGIVDWVNHKTGAAATYRFLAPPEYRAIKKNAWSVSLQLELLP